MMNHNNANRLSKHLFLALMLAGLVAGCGEPSVSNTQDPRSLMPDDAKIAALYLRSCYACHVNAGSRAPLTGDVKAWEPRMAQGMEQLLTHVIDGYGGMPPLGLCMDCSAEDFEALIHFMATGPDISPEPAQPKKAVQP